MKKHIITEAEYRAVQGVAKRNKDKRTDKRLQVILLRYDGKKDVEIGEKPGYHRQRISQLCAEFKNVGIEEYSRLKYGGNHQALSDEEEK